MPCHRSSDIKASIITFRYLVRVEAAGIHIMEAVFCLKAKKCCLNRSPLYTKHAEVESPASAPITKASAVFSSFFPKYSFDSYEEERAERNIENSGK